MSAFELPDNPPAASEREQLASQARAWVRLLASGRASAADARRLQNWCATSAAHADAFRTAHRGWQQLLPAAQLAGAHDPELNAIRAAVAAGRSGRRQASRTTGGLTTRRAFLGAAVTASVSAVGVALLYPPLDLWPSISNLQADYRTEAGQQMQLALASDITLDLNTRSSVSVRAREGEPVSIELLNGEVAVNTSRAFSVRLAQGKIDTDFSRFEVRRIADEVCVTCLEGRLRVTLAGITQTLLGAQQLRYDGKHAVAVRSIDPQQESDWRQGVLRFQKTALAQVVAEINRYRPGRLLLMADAVADRPVSGRFRIDDLDKAIAQIQRLFHLTATVLPGGIVVLR